MTTMREVEAQLEHHGVKGMKWGKHKAKTTSEPKRLSRKEVRTVNRKGQREFDEARINNLVATASKKGDKVLLKLTTPNSPYPTIVTGHEFINYLSNGGAMNVRATDIYATKDEKAGAYRLNETKTEQYQKVKR